MADSGSIKRSAIIPGVDIDYAVIARVLNAPDLYKRLRTSDEWRRLTKAQRDNARNTVFPNAKLYAAHGAPETVNLSDNGFALWKRLGSICRQIIERAEGRT